MVQLTLREMGTFWKSALRCLFVEMSNKTFFVIVLLAAWVAIWECISRSRQQRLHQCMVLVGALAGFLVHILLVNSGAIAMLGSSSFSLAGVVLLLGIGIKLHFEFKGMQKAGSLMKQGSGEASNPLATQVPSVPSTTWNDAAFGKAPFAAAEAIPTESATAPSSQGYGSTSNAADWSKEDRHVETEESSMWTLLAAGLISMALVFVLEAGTPTRNTSLKSEELSDLMFVLGSMLGYFLATCIAVSFGYIMQGMLEDEWLLFAAELVFFAMALVCFSQAILLLAPLSLGKTATVLLGLQSI